jgi:hypothetical protein
MGQRIHAGACGDEAGHAHRQRRVADGDLGIRSGWKMIFFLWVALLVSTPARPTSDPVPAVVGTASVGAILARSARVHQSSMSSRSQTSSPRLMRHQRDHLAQIQRRAAAEGDDPVMPARLVGGDARGHVAFVGLASTSENTARPSPRPPARPARAP